MKENETLIANHCRLFLPLGSYETVPDLAAHLPELRRIIREHGTKAAITSGLVLNATDFKSPSMAAWHLGRV